mgnify:CR=1 FL=1
MQLQNSLKNLPLLTAPKSLCTDNAAMIAWMGHEVIYAGQDIDIRDVKIDVHRKIPLGSFVKDIFISGKEPILTGNRNQNEQKLGSDRYHKEGERVKQDIRDQTSHN